MKNNPFTSDIFTSTWLKHFRKGKSGISFDLFPDLGFVKHRFLPLYINIGKTLTKGVNYSLVSNTSHEYRDKVFLIYDVPTYFEIANNSFGKLKLHRIKQYPGYLIKLHEYTSFSEYMNHAFNRKSRYKLRSYKNQLLASFDIHDNVYFGEISKSEYDSIFEQFRTLLEKRYTEKQVSNNNLEIKEWSFYKDVVYPMILAKKAALYVVNDSEKPIGIMLNYIAEDTLIVAITVFDIDYSKYNVGTVNIMGLIEWSIKQNIKAIDFSKGHYDYKKRWGSEEYAFEYHILYDSSSFYATCIAISMKYFFKLKQYLRDKNLNELLHKATFFLKKKSIQ